jgi:hypothetical protein
MNSGKTFFLGPLNRVSFFLQLSILAMALGCATPGTKTGWLISKWDRFEKSFNSSVTYRNPFQEVTFKVEFTSPTGENRTVEGFWDGEKIWRVRFAPNEIGTWHYQTICSDTANSGLHHQTGTFLCTAPRGNHRFSQHGPLRVSPDGRYLMHEDRTPFFWLGDTAWCGPLLSTFAEWEYYLNERVRQKFSAVQWVATQFRAAPDGDREKQLAYTGTQRIQIHPKFFQRLDEKVEAANRAGLLNVPVLLWAINGGSNPPINPGVSLPEDQAIVLARYLVARWGANDVVWILNGDGDYRGEKAERWKRIGRAVFGDRPHAPLTLHPGGGQWPWDEFREEKWIDICGYQSGHNETDDNLKWIVFGPPATEWRKEPTRPFISLEAPYENHNGSDRKPMSADVVRRAHYWSLLTVPTAGVTYGGHGVWGWNDGTRPPIDHPSTGLPLPWQQALLMPGAEQMVHLANFFTSIEWWRLSPAPEILAPARAPTNVRRYNAAAQTENRDVTVVYVPEDRAVAINLNALPPSPNVSWFNPRLGERQTVVGIVTGQEIQFPTPGEGDWVLLITAEK